jgi:AcrR family transcriptional regulator/DNA-binding MarR family transcriptional regulator
VYAREGLVIVAARKRPSGPGRSGARRGEAGRSVRAPQAYNGAVRSQLEELQRARIVSAVFDVAAERGAANMSVAHLVERAGVSRRTFYEIFTDREDALLAAFTEAAWHASERVLPAYESEKAWREKLRAGLIGLLSFFDEQPLMARLLIVGSLAGGPATQQARSEITATLTSAIEDGRAQSKAPETIPPLTGEGIVGGVLTVLHSRIAAGSDESLLGLTNELMSMIVLPYLGAPAARRELKRATPALSSEAIERTPLGDPFKEAGMRLTYRTVRVLMATAEHPGASNRLIADTAEITDQGQISKLLGRLERAGMLTNTGLGPGQGAPNVWTLTDKGRQVTDSIRANTEGGQSHGASER